MGNLERKLQHLAWRAGFGPEVSVTHKPRNITQAVKQLLEEAQLIQPLTVAVPYKLDAQHVRMLSPEEKKTYQQAQQTALRELNLSWLKQMAFSKAQLREKMTLFWHGHFASRHSYAHRLQLQNNTLRQHALGSFPELLLAISKDSVMLQYLNNQQNRKQHPNENFARELLELFTIGRGQYTEQDVKEAARAFTGWNFNAQFEFEFREKQHDFGEKTFLGKTGTFNGDDILRTLVEDPRTAEFLTTKLYTFFVSDRPHPGHIQSLSRFFYASNYNITALLEKIFTSEWFYAPELMGAHIKSPVELLAGLQRTFLIEYADDQSPLILQRALGQELFQPPNVNGWPGGQNWIDSTTLAFRLNVGPALVQAAALAVPLKPDNDAEPTKPLARRKDGLKIAQAKSSLSQLAEQMKHTKTEALPEALSSFLLQTPLPASLLELLRQEVAGIPSREEHIKQLSLRILSMPEYQLC